MATSKRIVTTDLDFDQIKQNLKTYLQGQDQFSDYDFEGSGLSILLDILAYNTHYNALHLNLAVNESFLDSASKRSSVVSKAKELGYIPMSAKCATATVDVEMINNQLSAPQTIEIGRYTPFNANVGGDAYTFYTQQSYLAYKQGNQYSFSNVELKEGIPISNTYVWATGLSIIIPNANVDINTLRVTVQESTQSSKYDVYSEALTMLNIDGTSPVYFIKEIEGGLYQVEFGNGIIGKALETGNVIKLEYMVTNGDVANGSRSFQYTGGAINNTEIYTSTNDIAYGGSPAETIDSIKWNAPRAYSAQNRCVTLDDYKSTIYRLYPNANSINVWGGEQNNPPSYGDIFISIQPDNAEKLSDVEKQYILSEILGPRKLVTMHPKIVDPISLHVELDVSFYYDQQLTTRKAEEISAIVLATIQNYNTTNLNKFGGILRYSNLIRAIDTAEESIKNSIVTLKLHRDVVPVFNKQVEYVIDIGNPIYNSGVPEESVLSTGLRVLGQSKVVYLDDLPIENSDYGKIRMNYYLQGKKYFIKNVGTIEYSKGIIRITDIMLTGLEDSEFKLIIKPQSNDVASVRNEIINIPTELVTIKPIIDTPANNYLFSSSRN